MKHNKKDVVLEELWEVKDYFLALQEKDINYNDKELLNQLMKITTSIILEENETSKKIKLNFLIFWINYIIDNLYDQLSNEIKESITNIIRNLDLFQLDSYIDHQEFNSELQFDIETRKIFNDKMILTNTQIDILVSILKNKSIIFSAPTSYGKSSIVVNAIFLRLFNHEIRNVVFIIPSKALINEYRKKFNRLCEIFNYKVDINENPYLKNDDQVQFVHLFTQERFLIFDQLNSCKIDYAIFDEVQDLIAIGKNGSDRSVILAKTISIIENKNIPMIFLMPYIYNPEENFINHFTSCPFIVKKGLLSPTTSNKYLIVKENNKYNLFDVTLNKGYANEFQEYQLNINNVYPGNEFHELKNDFYKICSELHVLDDKSLCYCNKDLISIIASVFQKEKENIVLNDRLKALINYLKNYIHPDFELVNFLAKGIAIHHADLDTFTKRQIEECFKDVECKLNMIFCTSTLLQGVNLNANNLFFLAKRGGFTNYELDKKNLFGRVGRIGSKSRLQGNIYKFWVEGSRESKESQAKELNTSNEEYVVDNKMLNIDIEKLSKNELLKSYYQDINIKKKLPLNLPSNLTQSTFDNFNYFLGKDRSEIVDRKINSMTESERNELENKLKLTNPTDCFYVITKLSQIYEWNKSLNFDEKYRMTDIPYITRVFYNNYIGRSIKSCIENIIKINKDPHNEYILTILQDGYGKEYPKILKRATYKSNPRFRRIYTDADINILIYSYIYETQNIIEFRVKKYLQDLYYRLLKSKGRNLQSIEDYLIYSTANNTRKINLNKIGLLDSFAIDELIQLNDVFDNDEPNIQKIKNYAMTLPGDNPLKYAILDVL